ncbi:GntR family transcriptional regulator [Paraburkholderia sp. GAS333]|uniref:GntR family transcriptional regulator n=1 Tax=Paraburkholderia sp. GAS333 TaxID=3156279 RepID=UPI003D20DD63
MQNWLPDLAERRGSIHNTLVESVKSAIRCGVLPVGATLPTQRLIADLLMIHVNTVNRAIAEVSRQGLVKGSTRRGTVVLSKDEKLTKSEKDFAISLQSIES